MKETAQYRNVTFDEIEIGVPITVSRMASQTEIEALALVSGDVDPYHIEPGALERDQGPISAQAVGAEAVISGLLNRRMPGPGTRIVAQDLRFRGKIVTGDTVTATVKPLKKDPIGHQVQFECTVIQGGVELVAGTVTVEAPTRRIAYDDVATPELILRHNDELVRLLRYCESLEAVACAIVHPCDRDSLLGALEAAKRGLIVPLLVGPEAKIRAVADAEGVDLDAWRIEPTEHSHAAAARAVELARAGEVESLMKGSLHTDELMGAVVSSATGLRTARRLSHVFVLDVPAYPRPLFITDAAINISPTLEDKADIVQNAIELAHMLGNAMPRVAVLAATDTVDPRMRATLDAATLCKMADRGQITGAVLDGPLAFDDAISLEAARSGGLLSPVAGQADILVVPDIESGNMLARQLASFADALAAGIVLGARVPIALPDRADDRLSRMASAMLTQIVARATRS
jgi:phosphate acetyltransferase